MYEKFFGLKQAPFSIAPDPRYLFMSDRHREALAHLLYGVGGGGGFVLLSGEIGAGKTTVCRCFLEQIPRRCNVAYIFNPKLTVTELLKSICDEFRIPYQHQGPGVETVKNYLDPLNEFLLKTHSVGQNNVLIIDEAQNLSAEVLEQLRLLTNLETSERKLLQIILIGQPELRAMLARPELEQLAQRVIARFHLDALSAAETAQYVKHRLAVAGLVTSQLFSSQALQRVYQLSRGVPRRINLLCDRALLGAYAEGKSQVDLSIVNKAGVEVFEQGAVHPSTQRQALSAVPWWAWGVMALGVGLGALGGAAYVTRHAASPQVPVAKAEALPPTTTSVVASAPTLRPEAGVAWSHQLTLPPQVVAKAEQGTLPVGSERQAWRELGRLWQLSLDQGEPCGQSKRSQVYCFKSHRGLGLIRQLGRPGVVSLRVGGREVSHAVLMGLDSKSVWLKLGGVEQMMALSDFTVQWRGDFATLWRGPVAYVDSVEEGNSGPAVDALAALLAAHAGEPAPLGPQAYDGALKARVAAFQQTHGLKPDGVAGPTTFMQLNRATAVDEPRLRTER